MEKPRILVSGKDEPAGQGKSKNYITAVERAGGIADYRYAPAPDLSYDGLLICGGVDTHPRYYGEEIDGAVDINEERDAAEWELIKAFAEAGKPILGICRGYQLLNIYFGGTLHQHIPTAPLHTEDKAHDITVEADSVLYRLYGDEIITVNSAHHQAVKVLGRDLRATAHWQGMVEALEHEKLPIFGVQWHPERMCFDNRREDTVDGAPIFEYFIGLCK